MPTSWCTALTIVVSYLGVLGCSGGNDANGAAGAGGAGSPTGGMSSGGANTGGSHTGGANTGGANTGGSGTAGTGAGTGGSGGVVVASGCPNTQTPGTWVNVTPSGALIGRDCGGLPTSASTLLVDPARPSDMYDGIDCDGVWKSTDCGVTWKKVSTGTNASKLDSGRPWYGTIDPNPGRDPSTGPTIYYTQGYGALGLWKSDNGGVDWTNVWNNNIYAADGVTNISSDVGSDIHSVQIVDPSESDHLIVSMHGYFGSQNNTGIYESIDGGAKWILHKTTLFTFSPHNNLLFAFDAKTWIVTPGTISQSMNMFRTSDGGANWTDLGTAPARGIARVASRGGSAMYASTDGNDGGFMSTDRGVSWTKMAGSGGHVNWVVATGDKVYTSDANYGPATIRHAMQGQESSWTVDPPGMSGGGIGVGTTFDGTHHIVVAAQGSAGIWRYVEP